MAVTSELNGLHSAVRRLPGHDDRIGVHTAELEGLVPVAPQPAGLSAQDEFTIPERYDR